MNKNLTSIALALILAVFDLVNMGTIKNVSLGMFKPGFMWLVTALYALQPWIFLNGLNYTSMTVLNLSWDLFSDILVTFSGLFYFRETLTQYKLFGVLFAILSIILFAVDGTGDISGGGLKV